MEEVADFSTILLLIPYFLSSGSAFDSLYQFFSYFHIDFSRFDMYTQIKKT